MSSDVERWRPYVVASVPGYSDTAVLALIHVESAGDPDAHREGSQFHGLLQMGRLAGIDAGMADRGRDTTKPLQGNPVGALQRFFAYLERYYARHRRDPERIAVLWKAGPGTLSRVNALVDGGARFDAAVEQAARELGVPNALEYLERFRRAFPIYQQGGGAGGGLGSTTATRSATSLREMLLDWLQRWLSPMGGLQALRAGCPECDGPEKWPTSRLQWYGYLVIATYALSRVVGSYPEITSAYRCAPCNERRGGAPASRHLATESGGAPYVAIDLQWQPGRIETILANLNDVPRYVRAATGLQAGVGVIAYAGRRRIHLDLRAADYVDDQT